MSRKERDRISKMRVMLCDALILVVIGFSNANGDENPLAKMLTSASKAQHLASPSHAQLKTVEKLFLQTFRNPRDTSLRDVWSKVEWELTTIVKDEQNFVVLHKKDGGSLYVVRCAQALPIALQSPHSFYDKHTRRITLQMFLASNFRAAAWNTIKRSTIDAAHTHYHYLNAFTQAFAISDQDASVVQIHGFSNQRRKRPPSTTADLIVSNSSRYPEQFSRMVATRLKSAFPTRNVYLFPLDVQELGGTTNVQAQVMRDAGLARFLHLEFNYDFRRQLRSDRELRGELIKLLSESYRSSLE